MDEGPDFIRISTVGIWSESSLKPFKYMQSCWILASILGRKDSEDCQVYVSALILTFW